MKNQTVIKSVKQDSKKQVDVAIIATTRTTQIVEEEVIYNRD